MISVLQATQAWVPVHWVCFSGGEVTSFCCWSLAEKAFLLSASQVYTAVFDQYQNL